MITNVTELTNLASKCSCGNKHFQIAIDKIEISHSAFEEAVIFLKEKSFQNVVIVTDKTIDHALQGAFNDAINKTNLHVTTCFVEQDEQGDVVADEQALVQVLLETPNETDVLLAVGSGTIHDITRFASYKMGKPFISIPTAPSVDGFNSMGAPIVVKGMKKTYQMQAPIALFAQIDVLANAPKKMIAAGFGDIIGKYTSLTDWTFSHLVGGEPYCPLSAKVTADTLSYCVEHVDSIAAANEEGVKILIEALVASGLAMLLIGHSAPASGGEHHISHCWEMEFLQKNRPAILHGAKVGVTTQLIADLYKNVFSEYLLSEQKLEQLRTDKNNDYINRIIEHKQEILEAIENIPAPAKLKEMLDQLEGDSTSEMLGVDDQLVQESIEKAHLIRDRYTILKFINENIR
ncbi:sn-glycerol-1-phosphate dehydrogenase [Halalkalibacter urbisdiaboli]|uniref:sn-glycerol-1-phosphate dehydrogenase n=1 Tax=Halalkalibacter urbisdiaboli TaxID=1960589 RepID=UPI000B44724E|nr:sn-glycerol-1-phosphate dehydrogenase [Halalkalibacter urbisdiaboli]